MLPRRENDTHVLHKEDAAKEKVDQVINEIRSADLSERDLNDLEETVVRIRERRQEETKKSIRNSNGNGHAH